MSFREEMTAFYKNRTASSHKEDPSALTNEAKRIVESAKNRLSENVWKGKVKGDGLFSRYAEIYMDPIYVSSKHPANLPYDGMVNSEKEKKKLLEEIEALCKEEELQFRHSETYGMSFRIDLK